MRLSISVLFLVFFSAAGMAQTLPADAPGAKDHAIVTRYAGSWLAAQEVKEFDAASIPSGPTPDKLLTVEGRITRTYYIAPAGRSLLEVQRNYEQALERAGATRRDACFEDACKGRQRAFRAFNGHNGKKLAEDELEGWGAVTLVDQWLDDDSYRWWYGTLNVAGNTLHVSVLSAKPGINALAEKYVATVVQVVEPKAMETGKVTVDATALARGLQAEGKIALYGVYFDTGKSELKPESKAQLDEMAKLLTSNAAMRVFVVGHTDNQGALEGNLTLSRARAQAVIDALVKNYKIDARRLAAAGVANYAPVASNANEAGRARNRRVELVLQ
jgi:outer membrane protein OmpA-like peptidoglycan-associated protein